VKFTRKMRVPSVRGKKRDLRRCERIQVKLHVIRLATARGSVTSNSYA